MTYERLLQEHDRIDRQLAKLRNIVSDDVPDPVGATLVLADLSEELRHHLAHEDNLMYSPIIAAKQHSFAPTADQFCQEFADLRNDWDRYLVEWTLDIVESDWPGFRSSTLAMIDRLALRVRAENDLLYIAALQAGVIPLRHSPAA